MFEIHTSQIYPDRLKKVSSYTWEYTWDIEENTREVPVDTSISTNAEHSEYIIEENTTNVIEGDNTDNGMGSSSIPVYRGILSESIADTPIETENRTYYTYKSVTIAEPISSNRIIESVISSIMSVSQELKLANDYNAAVISKSNDANLVKKKDRYINWLNLRSNIKTEIEEICLERGIE